MCTAGILIPMHFTIGVRLSSEDQKVGVDIRGHGEEWNRNAVHPTDQVTSTTNERTRPTTPAVTREATRVDSVSNDAVSTSARPSVEMQPIRKFRRHSVRDFLQEAFI